MARRKTWARPETAAEIERMGGRETRLREGARRHGRQFPQDD
jgi:hypothetical protein